MAHHSATTHQQQAKSTAGGAKGSSFDEILKRYRRPLILASAVILAATYFIKDIALEKTKEDVTKLREAESQYIASLPPQQNQLKNLFDTSEMLKTTDPKSLSRTVVTVSVANLALGIGNSSHFLFAFAMSSVNYVPDDVSDKAQKALHLNVKVHDDIGQFLARPPADAEAFRSKAEVMVDELTNLQTSLDEAGTELRSSSPEILERLEKKSSLYGGLITTLFLLGLILSTTSALYGLETVKEG